MIHLIPTLLSVLLAVDHRSIDYRIAQDLPFIFWYLVLFYTANLLVSLKYKLILYAWQNKRKSRVSCSFKSISIEKLVD